MLNINKNKFIAKFPNKNEIGYIQKKNNKRLHKKLGLVFNLLVVTKYLIGCGGRI